MSVSLIAAVGQNLELGKNNGLIFHLPSDLAFFRQTTLGHPVIMGLKTWQSLPHPLPGREHFIIARPGETVPDRSSQITIIRDLSAFKRHLPPDCFVIGGASIYAEFLPLADRIYLTEIAATAPADIFFPEFDRTAFTRTVIGTGTENQLNFTHVLYQRKEQK